MRPEGEMVHKDYIGWDVVGYSVYYVVAADIEWITAIRGGYITNVTCVCAFGELMKASVANVSKAFL